MGKANSIAPVLSQADTQRFVSKIAKRGEDECWLWMGTTLPQGYGVFKVNRRMVRAHRVAFLIATGIWTEQFVCHRCDVPLCCNPAHLFEGTALDNNADRNAKGRSSSGEQHWTHQHPENLSRGENHWTQLHPENLSTGDDHWTRRTPENLATGDDHWTHRLPGAVAKGENQGNAKLTEAIVLEIRARWEKRDATQRQLAQEYGLSRIHLQRILYRKSWKHI